MNYGQISSRVQFNLYGEGLVRPGFVTQVEGSAGIIAEARRDIQREYDLWFMREIADVTLTAGTYEYNLETLIPRIKHITEIWILSDGQAIREVEPMSGREAREGQLFGRSSGCYPLRYLVVGNNIRVWPTPDENAPLRIHCYRFLADLPDTGFAAYEDDLSKYGGDVVMYKASSIAAGMRGDDKKEASYDARYQRALGSLMVQNRQMCNKARQG